MEVLICAGRFLWIQELNIMADVASLKAKAARGVQYAGVRWSWKHWAEEFVETAKEC